MTKSDFKNFNSQLPTVTGFLGGITFTALILLFEKSGDMKLLIPFTSITVISILIPLTAVVSFLFILATLGSMRVPIEGGSVHRKFYNLIVCYIIAGFIGLMIIIPLVIVFYTLIGAIVVTIIEIITARLFIKESEHNPKLWD